MKDVPLADSLLRLGRYTSVKVLRDDQSWISKTRRSAAEPADIGQLNVTCLTFQWYVFNHKDSYCAY
jgi:hypothetical protein